MARIQTYATDSSISGSEKLLGTDAGTTKLFSLTDLRTYFTTNTSAGTTFTGSIVPDTDDSYDIGSSGNVVRNIFTGDLHLNNLSKEKGNDVDGTNGSWTIQEGQDDLYIINKLNGKKYRIPLEEVN